MRGGLVGFLVALVALSAAAAPLPNADHAKRGPHLAPAVIVENEVFAPLSRRNLEERLMKPQEDRRVVVSGPSIQAVSRQALSPIKLAPRYIISNLKREDGVSNGRRDIVNEGEVVSNGRRDIVNEGEVVSSG